MLSFVFLDYFDNFVDVFPSVTDSDQKFVVLLDLLFHAVLNLGEVKVRGIHFYVCVSS